MVSIKFMFILRYIFTDLPVIEIYIHINQYILYSVTRVILKSVPQKIFCEKKLKSHFRKSTVWSVNIVCKLEEKSEEKSN